MSAATPEQPRLLDGRYLLAEQLGRGGMADVYRAHDQVLNRDVAVKVFRTVPGEADRKRYETEVSTLASLRHPGLVLLFDAGTDDAGRPYAVMQLLEGASLADRDEDVRVPVPRVAAIGAALADALAFVHAHGVVHRDVKPANVLLDDDGRPLLADFGIARSLDATGVTGTGLTVGTAAYMAPEQVRGEPVDGSADVYALGLMLLELLTGYREYEGSAIEAALARLTRPPRLPDFIPPVWRSLLSHMTAPEPADRPTATQVAEWLRGDAALRGDGAWVPPARGELDSGSRQAAALSSSIMRSRADGVADATTGGFAGSGAFAAAATGTGPRAWRGEETYGGRTGTGAGFPAPPPPGPPVYGDEDGERRGGRLRLVLIAGGIAAVAAVIFGVAATAGLGSGKGSPDAVVPNQSISPLATSSAAPSSTPTDPSSVQPTTPGVTTAPSAGSIPTSGTSPSAGTVPTQGGGGVDPQPTRQRPTRKPVDPTTPPVTTPPVVTPPPTTPPVVTPTVVPPTTPPVTKPPGK